MENFGCIPQEILEKILEFLPTRDQINSGFVCAHWSEVVGRNLKHVTIDESMPFGGRWVEVNLGWIGQGTRSYEKMKKLISMLCTLTNKIETLNINEYDLDTESLTELLSSQTGIKALRIAPFQLPEMAKRVYLEKVVEAIIRNQETIEVIDIRIGTRFYQPYMKMSDSSITKIQEIITSMGQLSFPRLKSLTLVQESGKAIEQLLNKDIFNSFITSSQLEQVDCSDIDMLPYIRNGNLGLLRKFSLSYGCFYGMPTLIEHCPHITHLGGYTVYGGRQGYKRSVLRLISAYGPQLKHFDCQLFSWEVLRAILERCRNIESLVVEFGDVSDSAEGHIDDFLGFGSSLPLLGYLEKLTEIDIRFIMPYYEAEFIGALIEKCGKKLQSIKIKFEGSESHKIMIAIAANCKNLKNLHLNFRENLYYDTDEEKVREVRDSVNAIIEECQELRTFDVEVYGLDLCHGSDRSVLEFSDICDQIGKKLPHLKYVKLRRLHSIPEPNVVKLIHAHPYCEINFAR